MNTIYLINKKLDKLLDSRKILNYNECHDEKGMFCSAESITINAMSPELETNRRERLDLPNYIKHAYEKSLGEKLPPEDKNYFYHATIMNNVPSISEHGLDPNKSIPNFPSETNRHMKEIHFSDRIRDVPGQPYGVEYWGKFI